MCTPVPDSMEQKTQSFNIEEEYIVVSPQEAGEPPLEYCAQDYSRPKLFFPWGPLVPVGKAAATLLSGFLDHVRDPSNSPMASNITVTSASPSTSEDVNTNESETQAGKTTHSELHARRRKSLKKMQAVSSFGDCETCYSIQRFQLNSRQNSKDDYLVLKVKTKSRSPSLDSPLTPPSSDPKPLASQSNGHNRGSPLISPHDCPPDLEPNHPLANAYREHSKDSSLDTNNCSGDSVSAMYTSITSGVVCDSDSPALRQIRRASEQSGSNPGSTVLMRKPAMSSKSHSVPSSSELVDPRTLVCVRLNSELAPDSVQTDSTINVAANDCAHPVCPSEEDIKRNLKYHFSDFVKYSNWSALLPFLEEADLLNQDAKELLLNSNVTSRDKGLRFYLDTLPSQGNQAYTVFYQCLMKETDHMGHKTLQKYLCTSSLQV